MDDRPPNEVALLLRRAGSGDRCAEEELHRLLFREVHASAERLLRRERSGHTLRATELADDAILELLGSEGVSIEDRAQFLALASGAMRRLLVDHARRRNAKKRGGDRSREALDDVVAVYEEQRLDLIELDEALSDLRASNERAARVFELRFFGGLRSSEAAAALSVSEATAERGWAFARAWLIDRLGLADLHGAR